MRLFLIISACLLATPAGAQSLTVPMCEETAAHADKATQAYLSLSEPSFDDEADTMEAQKAFIDFCVNGYLCPAFEEKWAAIQSAGTSNNEQYREKPDYFSDLFVELKTACGVK